MSARKRTRVIKAKPDQLIAAWGRAGDGGRGERPDLQYAWGGSGACKSDGRILCEAIEGSKVYSDKTLRQELEARGYDITTLRISIEKKGKSGE